MLGFFLSLWLVDNNNNNNNHHHHHHHHWRTTVALGNKAIITCWLSGFVEKRLIGGEAIPTPSTGLCNDDLWSS